MAKQGRDCLESPNRRGGGGEEPGVGSVLGVVTKEFTLQLFLSTPALYARLCT